MCERSPRDAVKTCATGGPWACKASAARPWCTYSVPNNVWLVRVIKGLLPDAWWHAFNYALVKTLWKTGVSLFRGEALPAPPKARSSSPKRK